MPTPDSRSLLDVLQEIAALPEYMRADAIKNTVAEWRRRSPLVEEVVSGHTTFEKAITALVQENSRIRYFNSEGGACSSPQFEAMAKETATKFADILPLFSHRFVPRAGIVTHDLTDSLSFSKLVLSTMKLNIGLCCVSLPAATFIVGYFMDKKLGRLMLDHWIWVIAASAGFGLFLSLGQLLVGYPHYLSDRRRLAKKTLERAKFLDSMLQLHRVS